MTWLKLLPPFLLSDILFANKKLRECVIELQNNGEPTVAELFRKTPTNQKENLLTILENLEIAETSRREQLDSKANSLLSGATLALTALGTAGTLLLTSPKQSSTTVSAIMDILPWTLMLCCICWAGAVLMVYKSLNIVEFDVLCSASVRNLRSAFTDSAVNEQIAKERWLNAVLNEPRLTIKSNWLSGARTLYETGISILLLSIILIIAITIYPWILFGIYSFLPLIWIILSIESCFVLCVIVPPLVVFYIRSKFFRRK